MPQSVLQRRNPRLHLLALLLVNILVRSRESKLRLEHRILQRLAFFIARSEHIGKKQRIKTAPGAQDFTKAGLFHCKEGTPFLDLFPITLKKKYCSFFCLHGKKCSKSSQVCEYEHIGKWDKIPTNDQIKILEHCHATQGKKIWLDAKTFAKHKNTIPDKYAYLLRDSKGPKST
jgi:hypothetical protein